MKFKNLKLNNFRQYIGEQTVSFCDNTEKNVTLIFGANGFGKTGIFRAIMFALYNERSLAQDALNNEEKREGLILVNQKLLEQSPNTRITAEVTLEFEDNSKNYVLKRSISAINTNGKITQERGNVSLIVSENHNTNPPTTDEDAIKEIISSLINEKIKDFFLFDGEQMEELTKYSAKSRQEVKKGIKTLLQLDSITISQEALKKYEKEINRNIEANSADELEIVSEELGRVESRIEVIDGELHKYSSEYELASQIEQETLIKIQENGEVLAKQKDREITSSQIKNLQTELDKLKKNLKEKLEISGAYVASPVVIELATELQTKYDRGELPSGVRKEFIEKLLRQCRCICGNNLNEHPEAKEVLGEYSNSQTDEYSDAAIKVHHMANELKVSLEREDKEVEAILVEYEAFNSDLDNLKKKLDRYNEELKDIKGVEDLGMRLEKLKADQIALIEKTSKNEAERKGLVAKQGELRGRQETLSKNNEKLLKLIEQRNIVKDAIIELQKIYEEYSDELRTNLSLCATEIFCKIADENSLKSLAKIVILDDFQLEVLSHSGAKMLSQISSGQRQIVSLSYICALLQVGNNLEMPLLMDTPFGRLSGSPRDACLKNLPLLLPQWILLTTDTEFQKDEASVLRASSRWGAVYEIYHTGDRESVVKAEDIDSWQPQRKRVR